VPFIAAFPILARPRLGPRTRPATRAAPSTTAWMAWLVSNHGGRQVDGAIATLDALPGIVDAVAGAVPVLFDSGVRGGADVFKALALGATAVCLGRPYVYGLALTGERGVREVIENVVAELDLTLGLSGLASVAEIGARPYGGLPAECCRIRTQR